jgi:hypothetical protein
MPYPIELINGLERGLSDFINWGLSKKIKFSGSRVLKYVDCLRSYRDALKEGSLENLIKSQSAAYLDQIPYEMAELVYLYKSLYEFNDPRLVSRFQSIVQGSELIADDQSGSSRDFQFELHVAAILFQAKINKLRFDTRHDLICSLYHNPLIIECKRPRKDETIKTSYAAAAYQIESSSLVKTNPMTRGIVALDLTEVILPALDASPHPSLKAVEQAFVKIFVSKWSRLQLTISDYSDRVSALHLFSRAPWYININGSYVAFQGQHHLVIVNVKDHQENQKIANTYKEFLDQVKKPPLPFFKA